MTSASRTIGTKTKEAIADFEQKDGMPVNGRWRREIPKAQSSPFITSLLCPVASILPS